MNFGYIIGVFLLFFLVGPFYNKEHESRWNAIRCAVSFIGVAFWGYVLIKIYEVPVYYTKIDTVLINSIKNENDTLNIKIIRNYDRPDKGTILEDISDSLNNHWINTGGIFITGSFHYKNGNITEDNRICDSITNVIENKMQLSGKKIIKNPQYAYISALTSYRQIFGIYYHNAKKDSFSLDKGSMVYQSWKGGKFIKADYVYDDYFWYKNYKPHPNHNGYILEEYYATSEKDSILYVNYFANPIACSKPSILLTAEDISKIVEVIEIGDSTWSYLDRLEFDYVGPSEFSSNILPQPDTITLNSIIYTDKEKISQIGANGLRFHVNFPDMENIQEAKIFIVSSIVTGLGALFLKYLFNVLQDLYQGNKQRIKRWHYIVLILMIIILIIALYFVLDSTYISSFDIQNEMMQKQ